MQSADINDLAKDRDEHDRHRDAEKQKHASNGDRRRDDHSNGHEGRDHDGQDHDGEGQEGHDDSQAEPLPENLPQISSLAVSVVAIVFVAMLAGLFFIGWLPQHRRTAQLREESKQAQAAKPRITATFVSRQKQSTELRLPGDVRALQQTSIYPRANGYLKKLYVDIGDKVEAGQLLADIDTPEVDAQLEAARASVAQNQANLGKAQTDYSLAQTTIDRYEGFAKTGGVTQQQLDEQRNKFTQAKANLEGAVATLAAARADVQRYEALQSFEKIPAPFAGTVNTRGFDVGALLSSSNQTGTPLFSISQTDTLRVFVSVPQNYVTTLEVGHPATFEVRNYPGKPFNGKVTRSSGALDPSTRTVQYQVDFDNKAGLLYPGMFGEVKFKLGDEKPSLIVPSSSLVFDAKGLRVATLDDSNKVKFKTIVAGRDYGTDIEVLEGLDEGQKIVANPGERIVDGTEVDIAQPTGGNQPKMAEGRQQDGPKVAENNSK